MSRELAALAFAAGLVAALNPCGFAMLPAYLALLGRDNDAGAAAARRALLASAAMTAGFIFVFTMFGLAAASVASALARYLPGVTVFVGVVLVGVGAFLVAGRTPSIRVPAALTGRRWAPTARLYSWFGYGVAYALASLSCTVAPFLAVTGAAATGGGAVAVYSAYAAGFGIVVTTAAMAAVFASAALAARIRQLIPVAHRAGGILVVVIGCYVVYYGIYELRLVAGDPASRDPVIGLAGRLQGTVAGWVHAHGAWPWLAVLAVLIAAAGLRAVASRRHRT